MKVFEEAKIPFNWASTTYVPIFDRLYLEKSTTTTLKMVGSQALLVSTKKSMQHTGPEGSIFVKIYQ